MTGSTAAWGIVAGVFCVILGAMIAYPLGRWRGEKHAREEARWKAEERRIRQAREAPRPVPVRPPVPGPPPSVSELLAPPAAPPPAGPVAGAGPGKHRHNGGGQHAALPVGTGYLPAPDGMGPWNGTVTMPAPAPAHPPWNVLPAQPEPPRWPATAPEPVLEPTAADCHPPDPLTDSAWTRQKAREMDEFIAGLIGATDGTLKAITK